MKRLLLKIASLIYGAAIKLRHLLFDINVLHGEEFEVPVICVGNITVGGTGKTPAVEMLVDHFLQKYNRVAVLSRGYGRRTRGYREVALTDSYRDVGDEPLQIKLKFPDAVVVVCEKRVDGIERLMEDYPDLDLIIMDDGFQHRYVKPFINIIMVDATRPIDRDHLLPYGQLRDTADSLVRAHYFLVTKCPPTMKPIDERVMRKNLEQAPYQHLYFAGVKSCGVRPIFSDAEAGVTSGGEVIAMSGIGNNEVFNKSLKKYYNVVATLDFDDHHAYRKVDLVRIGQALDRHPEAVIITTEKDAVKLVNSRNIPLKIRSRLYYESIEMNMVGNTREEFLGRLEKDINQRKNGTYIRGC